MRILYLNHNLNRFDSEAGVWARDLVEELTAAGAQVDPVPALESASEIAAKHSRAPRSGIKALVLERAPQSFVLLLVELSLQLRGLSRTLRTSWRLWRTRKQHDCDVIVARTYEYDWTPGILSWLYKRPLVLEIHSLFHLERQLRGRPSSRLLRYLEAIQLRRAAQIWVNTHELETFIGQDIDGTDRITCIGHGINMAAFEPFPRIRSDETVRVMFVASFYPWHGAEILVDAFAKALEDVPNLHLSLIGDGLTRAACEAKVQQLGISSAVEFTGWISREQVFEHLLNADIGVAPYSKLDPFYFDPVKILEYMAAGLPVIATRQGSIDRTIGHESDGLLVPPDDCDALADALRRLASDRSLRQSYGEAARDKIARNQSWDLVSKKILTVCNAALADGGSSPRR